MNAETKGALAVDRRALRRAMALVRAVTDQRMTIPILAHVEIAADGIGMTLRATDMETDLTIPVATAAPSAPMRATVNARDLGRLAGVANGESLTLARDGDFVTVVSGAMRARLFGMDPADLPAIAMGAADTGRMVIGAETLRGMLDRAAHAISTEETRYYLNGVFLELSETDGERRLTAVATDGHRLAALGAVAPRGATWPAGGVIVPRRAVGILRAMLAGCSDAVSVTVAGKVVEFVMPGATLRCKAIDGTFPDWRRVVPQDGEPATFGRAALLAAVNRVTALSRRDCPAVEVTFSRGEAHLRAVAKGEWEMGEAIPFDGAADAQVGINYAYLRATLAQIGGDVTMHVIDGHQPIRFTDAADPRAMFVLMPRRI